MKNRNKKAGVAIAAASVITAGAVTVAVAYQSGVNFQPKDSNRKLQNNQVVFSDNKDQVEHTEDDNGDNSELWEKIRMISRTTIRKMQTSRTISSRKICRMVVRQL